MRKLDILIPQYTETEDVIKPLLDSLAIQQNIDFNELGVIICNDGSDTVLSADFLNSYDNLNITYLHNKHKGVSAARNKCLDSSEAEYVMFCDADDMFYNSCGLYILFNEMKQGFDSLSSVFVEETRNPETKEIVYINRENDTTFVHGKVHRRQFLIDNNIRWDENLTIHEDSYFNVLCKTLAGDNYKYITATFYLWRWRDDSVCRRDPLYMLKTYVNMIQSCRSLVCELLIRGKRDEAGGFVTTMIYETYYALNKKEWLSIENINYRIMTEKSIKSFMTKFKVLFDGTPAEIKTGTMMNVRNRMCMEGFETEAITFNDWIKHIESEVE